MEHTMVISAEGLSQPELLKIGQEGILSSDIAGILGVTCNYSAMQVYLNKVAPIEKLLKNGTSIMSNLTNPELVKICKPKLEAIVGKKIEHINAIIRNKEHPFVIGEIEYVAQPGDIPVRFLDENDISVVAVENRQIPMPILMRSMHDLLATGAQASYLAIRSLSNFHWFSISLDKNGAMASAILELEAAFWSVVTAREWGE